MGWLKVMPMEDDVTTSFNPSRNGLRSSFWMRSASSSASDSFTSPSINSANSSPPSRANVSPSRRHDSRRRAMNTSI